MEEEIEKINKDLQKQMEEKEKAERKKDIVEQTAKAKQQFLAHMSHEIRTPLNSLVGFTEVILRTGLNKDQKEYLKAIKESGDTLLVIINDILDIAKVDA